jgi:hypothetical protein
MRWPDEERYSQPWMKPWLEAAAGAQSVLEACRHVGISLAAYLVARRDDRAFDEAALVVDQVLDLMIQEATRLAALDGNVSAQRLYYDKVRRPAFLPPFASWSKPARAYEPYEDPLPPHVAAAMLAAGRAALAQDPPPSARK